MKLGLFGGSFDPVHCGHVRPAQEARRQLGLDRVLFLPTAQPPHKQGQRFAPALARFCMVELALLREEGLFVSSHELTLGRACYTAETLEHFQGAHPEAELYLLLGADSFADLHRWRRWQDIVASAHLAVLARPGWEPQREGAKLPAELASLVGSPRVHFVANQPVAVSSTELRALFARGEVPSADLVPEMVVHYIQKYALYDEIPTRTTVPSHQPE